MHTTGSLARMLGAQLVGPADLPITRLGALEDAQPGALAFIRSSGYAAAWRDSAASAAIVTNGVRVPGHDPSRHALLRVPDADLAVIKLLELFAPPAAVPAPGVHPSACIDPSARVDAGASIGPNCTIGAGAAVGAGAVVCPNVFIGAGASIGAGCVLHPGVVVMDRCTLGPRCILHPGVVIGADGFGYHATPKGPMKVPHIGAVEIGADVEIGANSCIDRAKFGATVVGDGTKIDNLVQIAHNCTIGRCCIICGSTGLAGSVRLGDGVVLGGGVGIGDNLTIGAGARIAARAAVMNNIPPGETWMGIPAGPAGEQSRNYAAFRRLAEFIQRFRQLEKSLLRTHAGAPPDSPA